MAEHIYFEQSTISKFSYQIKLKNLSDKKIKEYEVILENSKKEVTKILLDSKNSLNKDIQTKKNSMEKEIENEISKAQKEILVMKKLLAKL